MAGLVRRARDYVKHHGVAYTLYRCGEKAAESVFKFYDHTWRKLAVTPQELEAQRAEKLDAGLISVVVPVYNTNPGMLREMVDSILAQTYQHWEAILYDDCSPSDETCAALEGIRQLDGRIRVYRGEKNQGISGSTNSAIALAAGEWIALMDHDDLLTPDALYHVAKAILEKEPELIYSDEDKITEDGKRHTDPHFKPEFCPDNLRSGNYFCHLMVIRKALIEKAGGFRTAFNGSQDHDLALRCIEQTDRIVHIPRVLYHWRSVKASVSHQNLMKCVNAACAAVQEHMERIGWPGTAEPCNGNIRLRYDIKGQPMVGVYIFGQEDTAFQRCADAMKIMDWPHMAVHKVKIGEEDRYAAMNRAAASATEDVLLMMDASVQVTQTEFVTELLMYAQRDDVGAVTPEIRGPLGVYTYGGREYDTPEMERFCKAGLPFRTGGLYFYRFKSHNVAGVSPACFMIRKDHIVQMKTERTDIVEWEMPFVPDGLRHMFTPYATCMCREWSLPGSK